MHVGELYVFFGGGKTFLPEYVYEKFTKCPNFTWYLPEKYFFSEF